VPPLRGGADGYVLFCLRFHPLLFIFVIYRCDYGVGPGLLGHMGLTDAATEVTVVYMVVKVSPDRIYVDQSLRQTWVRGDWCGSGDQSRVTVYRSIRN